MPPESDPPRPASSPADPPRKPQVRTTGGFALVLELADPSRFGDLQKEIEQRQVDIEVALESLHYVHFARFLPLPRQRPTHLIVISEYDGADDAYILDFAAVMGDVFNAILRFVKDPPPLPVAKHPYAFLNFVRKHDVPVRPWSAYGDRTVLELLHGQSRTTLPAQAPKPKDAATTSIADADVQGNLLRSYHATLGHHFALRVVEAAKARAFLGGVTGRDADWPQVSSARDASDPNAKRFLNIGLTFSGLRMLGVPETVLDAFPQAFREGPAHGARAADIGDTDENAPDRWLLGSPDKPVDLLVSFWSKEADETPFEEATDRLRKLFDDHGLRVVYHRDTRSLPDGQVHFGYRDGIAQPRIAGLRAPQGEPGGPDCQPLVGAGDFLLGGNHCNRFDGNWIEGLPPWLCNNATYAAVRMLSQNVAAFERLLETESKKHNLDPEWLAAKLMGRWRTGEPLALSPKKPPETTPPLEELNDFNYGADPAGKTCPLGSHVRRMNPRGAPVAGKPYSRRIIRRGMSYGRAWKPEDATTEGATADDDGNERGVFGLFLCADLQSQYEFILSNWANGDRAAAGLHDTQDPIAGTRKAARKFRLPIDGRPDVVIEVPPLVTTRGSLYLLVPGIDGLKNLARLAGAATQAGAPGDAETAAAPRRTFNPKLFDPADAAFRADPYPTYAWFRGHEPVAWVPRYKAWWVFSHALVTEVCNDPRRFPKKLPPPGSTKRQPESLFYMDPPRHTEVRRLLDRLFGEAIPGRPEKARGCAGALLENVPPAFDFIATYAKPLPRDTLMDLMGIAEKAERAAFEARIDVAFAANNPLASVTAREAGEAAREFIAKRFVELMKDCPAGGCDGLLCAMVRSAKELPEPLSETEQVRTAISFMLAGYLSSEFLLGAGVYRLLEHRDQWDCLKNGDKEQVDRAVQEMLRCEAPFQLADRYAAEETALGGVTIPAGAKVIVVYGSANRDEAVFGGDADQFKIDREPGPDQPWGALGLSVGNHRCIGEPLIRDTLPIAVKTLAERLPDLDLDGEPVWNDDPYFRSLRRLPVVRARGKKGG